MNKGLNWYLYYKEQYYDAGTKVKIQTKYGDVVVATYIGYGRYDSVNIYEFHHIIEVIEPIYYMPQKVYSSKKTNIFTRTRSGSWQSHSEVCLGLVWYIVVMIVATLFVDRIGLWVLITFIFFSWKGKK